MVSREIKAIVRAMYLSGVYATLEDTYRAAVEAGLFGEQPPNINSLQRWAKEGGWVCGANQENLEARAERNIEQMFTEAGMPAQRAIRLCVDGMTAGSDRLEEVFEMMHKQVEVTGQPLNEEIIDVVKKMFRNLPIQHKFLQTYVAMTGMQAPVRHDVTSKGRRLGTGLDRMSQEEMAQAIMKKLKGLHVGNRD